MKPLGMPSRTTFVACAPVQYAFAEYMRDPAPYLEDVAHLRIAVFREFPYLYDGDPGYEARYLQVVGAFARVLSRAEVVESVRRVTDIMAAITAASSEQSAGIEQVNRTVMRLDEATQQNAALVEEASAAAHSLEEQARQLAVAAAAFRLDRSAARAAARQATSAGAARCGAVEADAPALA